MERYYSFARYCKEMYGHRLYKVCLDAGMTCPVRDGTLGTSGCAFCAGGSGDFAIPYQGQKLTKEDLLFNHRAVPEGYGIGYFQAYTNTYAPVEKLRALFSAALADPLFAGISIATRPDCMGPEVLALLRELKMEFPGKFIWIELGLQTCDEACAEAFGRGYPNVVYDACVRQCHALGIPVITHLILGLPQEEDFLVTIDHMNAVHSDGVKLQCLQLLRGTFWSSRCDISLFSEDEYVDLVVRCLAGLSPDIVIHRLTGDGPGDLLIGPLWTVHKGEVLNRIGHALKEQNVVQGCEMFDNC